MKIAIPVLAFLAMLTFGVRASAQTLGNTNELGQAANSTAIISPGALTVNTLPASPFTAGTIDQRVHTNQAASTAPAFGVQGIGCVKPGKGVTVQTVGGGASVALTGDMDDSCEAPRDINTMNMSGGFSQEDKQRRACAVPAIAKASPAACKRLLESAQVVEGFAAPAPVAQRAMPWQAGG